MNTYNLRYYQEEAVEKAIGFFLDKKQKKNLMLIEPTGSGKSIIIAEIARRLNDNVLVLAPSKELIVQNYNKFKKYGFESSIYSASVGVKEISNVTFATIGSIYKKPEDFAHFKYALIDECHKLSPKEDGMYVKFFETINMKILGLTATPFRLKSYNFPEPHSQLNFLNRMIPRFFQDVLHVTQIWEMTDNNWWSPLIYEQDFFDASKLQLNSTGANYTDQSITKALKENNTIDKVIKWANKLKEEGRKQVIIYLPSIAEANLVADKLKVDSISSETDSKEREAILSRFEQQKTWAIVNVSVLAIGYDNQLIDGIIDASPTLSLAMYYQRNGRGVRIAMDGGYKENCKIVDLVGNYQMFGKIEDLEIKQVAGKWVVMSGNRVLTNTPLVKGVEITPLDDEVFGFGKFGGQKFKDVPKWYWEYIKKNFTRRAQNEKLFQYIDYKKF